MKNPVTKVIPTDADPEVRLRLEWALSLQEHMDFRSVDKKELRRRLCALGVDVTRQAVDAWLSGETSPRPHIQRAIGTALDLPARTIFQIENLPRAS